jgi:signal transduction histidine kinase
MSQTPAVRQDCDFQAADSAPAKKQPQKILLVEDDAEDARLLRAALARGESDFDIVQVPCLAEALEQISCSNFDLILLDLSLPDSQGFDTVMAFRQIGKTVPVVVLTGLSDESVALRALRAGAQDYLLKGAFADQVFTRSLRYAIERHRLLAALESANQHIADFSAMMVHDLRSPLVNVIAIAEMLSVGGFGPLTDDQKKWLCRIVTNGHGLVELITNYLDFSKLEAGHMVVIKEALDVDRVLTDITETYALLAQERKITLEKKIAPGLVCVPADLPRLKQVLSNLLSNALKFTPKDGVIEVGASRSADQAVIWVKDSGPGIPSNEIGQLFEKYKQTASGRNSEEKGTGLGLLISKMIVEAHGGRIWAESESASGAKFTFTLPVDGTTAAACVAKETLHE